MYYESVNFISILDNFAHALNNFKTMLDETNYALSIVEQEIQDLLHDIEVSVFGASDGYKELMKLKEARIRRRYIKNRLEILTSFRDSFYNNNQNLEINLFKTIKNLNKIVVNQGNKKYVPRIRTDLKCISS